MKKLINIVCTSALLTGGMLLSPNLTNAQAPQDPPKSAVESKENAAEPEKKEIKAYKANRLDREKLRTVTPPPKQEEVRTKKQEVKE